MFKRAVLQGRSERRGEVYASVRWTSEHARTTPGERRVSARWVGRV